MTAIQQILHVLRKDLRAHLSEIASLAILNLLLIVFCTESWTQATQYSGIANSEFAAFIRGTISIVLVFGWAVVISRAIHAESPASHSQMWLTRPYSRMCLIAEKAIFILLFVHVLTAVSQLLILLLSGVPFSLLSLLANHLVLLCFVTLPIAVIASLTSTLSRFTIVMLPVACAWLVSVMTSGIATPLQSIPRRGLFAWTEMVNDSVIYLPLLVLPVLAIGGAATILWQYRNRDTRSSAAAAVLAGLIAIVMMLYTPASVVRQAKFALVGKAPEEIRMTLRQTRPDGAVDGSVSDTYSSSEEMVVVEMPVEIGNVELQNVAPSRLHVTVRAESGRDLDTVADIGTTPNGLVLFFYASRDWYESVADESVSIAVDYELKIHEWAEGESIPFDGRQVIIDNREQCGSDRYERLVCRSALRGSSAWSVGTWYDGGYEFGATGNRAALLRRQKISLPYSINPISHYSVNRNASPDQSLPVRVSTPTGYAAGSLRIDDLRLSDWLQAPDEND